VATLSALALGHLGDQEHRLEADGHGLQLAETPSFAADLPALAMGANQQVRLGQQEKPHTTVQVFGAPILVPFPDAKRMIQKTLTHASYYQILIPDSNFPEEPSISSDISFMSLKLLSINLVFSISSARPCFNFSM
jgi:hypothetical protein